MQNLRQKVFKKVKPKQLNGRILTGQLFLELCHAYTESINKGSVPSIEGAWTSLCKNENMRSMKDAVRKYEKEMNDRTYLDAKKQKSIEYHDLKLLNKTVTTEVLADFRQQAFGEDIEECVAKIEKDISEKYL